MNITFAISGPDMSGLLPAFIVTLSSNFSLCSTVFTGEIVDIVKSSPFNVNCISAVNPPSTIIITGLILQQWSNSIFPE